MTDRKPRAKNEYVNKNDLLQALVKYREDVALAQSENREKPVVPRYVGECIWNIANGIAMRDNFSNYPFKEDMIMDGVENCLLYLHNFDPEKSNNPFGYFSKIIWYAFLRRISKEKKQMYIRFKSSDQLIALGQTYEGGDELMMHMNVNMDYINDFIRDYEAKELTKAAAKKKSAEPDNEDCTDM